MWESTHHTSTCATHTSFPFSLSLRTRSSVVSVHISAHRCTNAFALAQGRLQNSARAQNLPSSSTAAGKSDTKALTNTFFYKHEYTIHTQLNMYTHIHRHKHIRWVCVCLCCCCCCCCCGCCFPVQKTCWKVQNENNAHSSMSPCLIFLFLCFM